MRTIVAATLAALALSGCIAGSISYPCVTEEGETCTVTIDRSAPQAPVVVPAPPEIVPTAPA